MLFTDVLYENVKDLWEDFSKHPFVDGIGSGKLEQKKFKFYLMQDHKYLLDYAKVFSLGVAKSNDREIMAKFASLAEGILNTEMDIHRTYMKKLGITEEEINSTPASLANISYTHYMLAVAYGGNVADISVSLLSCLWSYEVIAKNLYNRYGLSQNNDFYAEWISGYMSESYHELTIWLLGVIDAATKNSTEEEKKKLIEIFVNTTRYEGLFWDMAYAEEM